MPRQRVTSLTPVQVHQPVPLTQFGTPCRGEVPGNALKLPGTVLDISRYHQRHNRSSQILRFLPRGAEVPPKISNCFLSLRIGPTDLKLDRMIKLISPHYRYRWGQIFRFPPRGRWVAPPSKISNCFSSLRIGPIVVKRGRIISDNSPHNRSGQIFRFPVTSPRNGDNSLKLRIVLVPQLSKPRI